MSEWDEYHKRAGSKPNPMVVQALEDHVIERNAALDLGAGNLRDSKYLLNSGFKRVVAVDEDPVSSHFLVPGIDLQIEAIERYTPESGVFDLIVCCNTLFFLSVVGMELVIRRSFEGLRSGGILTCNLLGERDGWVLDGNTNVDFVTSSDLDRFLDGWKQVLPPGEIEYIDTHTNKAWHMWSLLLQKP